MPKRTAPRTRQIFFVTALFAALFCIMPSPAGAQLLTGFSPVTPAASNPAPAPLPPSQPAIPLTSALSAPATEPDLVATQTMQIMPTLPQAPPVVKPINPYPLSGAVIPAVDKPAGDPVNLQADSLEHNDQTKIITATGHVMLVQSGRTLRADQITYDLANDKAHAKGHVVLNEVNGDVHYADEVELNDQFKDGFVQGLKTQLADGSRFTADNGKRKGGTKTTMYDASYTPCEPCKLHPEKSPLWQIKAGEVEHDEDEHKISYKNATFEVFGVPVAYTPYFAHADGTIKQKSGFVEPTAGYTSSQGAFLRSNYYWAIAPDEDATIGVTAMTQNAPLLTGEFRKRWNNAESKTDASITYSDRTARDSGVGVEKDDELRGHIFSKNLWDIDEKWRTGLNIQWASDDQFLREYDINGKKDVLENELYAERFSGRDYTLAHFLTFQDVRVRDQQEDQPQVLPEIITSFVGEPGSVPLIGGRWNFDASVLGLRRDGNNADENRLSLDGGYQKRLVSDYGLLTNIEATLRSDSYYTRDRTTVAEPDIDNNATVTRLFPQMNIQSSYPVSKQLDNAQVTVEPIVALTLAPNIDVNNKIPNEDSRDVQIDPSNLFQPNRFPGLDRVEDQSRITAGLKTGLYDFDGNYGSAFLGQSYRLDADDNPFPEGSGLSDQSSDVVGQISARTAHYDLNYRFQLDSQDLSSRRHEADASASLGRWIIGGQYLFARPLEGTDIDESREQVSGGVGYNITDEWQVRTGGVEDLGESPGLRQAYVGLDYFGQCLYWSFTGQRNLTTDFSGESDTEILFRIGLKNLGDFQRSPYHPVDEAHQDININGSTSP